MRRKGCERTGFIAGVDEHQAVELGEADRTCQIPNLTAFLAGLVRSTHRPKRVGRLGKDDGLSCSTPPPVTALAYSLMQELDIAKKTADPIRQTGPRHWPSHVPACSARCPQPGCVPGGSAWARAMGIRAVPVPTATSRTCPPRLGPCAQRKSPRNKLRIYLTVVHRVVPEDLLGAVHGFGFSTCGRPGTFRPSPRVNSSGTTGCMLQEERKSNDLGTSMTLA